MVLIYLTIQKGKILNNFGSLGQRSICNTANIAITIIMHFSTLANMHYMAIWPTCVIQKTYTEMQLNKLALTHTRTAFRH